ncbi:MAG TPA: C-terminal binding protein [Planctomycetaceae bacterium]|nr:C-terminal binding protein [Planctomycetaceae bacterium]
MPRAARLHVLFTDRAWPDCEVERRIVGAIGAEVIEPPDREESTFLEFAPQADAIATCWAPVSGDVIRAATRCRIVARFGIGLDNIDVVAATERGIPVTNVPDYCISEVSDHALALLLGLARKVAFFHHRTKQGDYNLQAGSPLVRVAGKTLGLIGLGRIGQALAVKARALGLEVVAYNRSGDDHGTGCRMLPLDELLKQSDFVSLHVPLTPETRGLVGREQFGRMKRGAHLINTSRGGLVDHGALWQALQAGELAGAGLDVFDPEPPDLAEPLFRDERVIVTPHAAFLSQESLFELRTRAADQIAQALQGARPAHVVNPQIYEN